MPLNIDYVRQQFPGLNDQFILFDNAGGSQIAQPVLDRINHYLINYNVQLGATYQISQAGDNCLKQAQESVRILMNAQSDSEIIMGASTSMLLRILAGAFSQVLKPGDEIIVTNCDHEANISPWRELERFGIIIKEWKISIDDYCLDPDDLKQIMNGRTKLVAVTHVSNILGTINPIKEIARLVHQNDALICVDGVAYAPHRAIDVCDLDVDFYAFSFYKVFGPHQAVLYGKKELLLELPGYNHYFIEETDIPYKFQPGNLNYELSYGCHGICDYLEQLSKNHQQADESLSLREKIESSFQMIADYEAELSFRLLDFLNSRKNVKIIGSKDSSKKIKVPTISFIADNIDSQKVTLATDKYAIGIRFGDFYARRLIEDLGLTKNNGVIRTSMVHYNTLAEVDRLIVALDQVI